MNLLEKINHCTTDEELDKAVKDALDLCIKNAEKKELLGFETGLLKYSSVYKGFIHPETRIKFSNLSIYTYSMKTMDFYYEFARYLKKMRINDKGSLIASLVQFLNNYLGFYEGKDVREDYLHQMAFNTTKTDEELFEKIENFEIGDFKHHKIGMCTERAAIAQNILSLFGFESYYCMGCVKKDDKEECHCFNIVKAVNNYRVVDCSIIAPYYINGSMAYFVPLVGDIDLDKTQDFMFNQEVINFPIYEYKNEEDGIKRKKINDIEYIIGTISFDKKETRKK